MFNFIGVIVSFIYFFGLLFIAPIFKKNLEISRKFVHIMLGNWWFIVILFFNNVWAASIVPFSFIFINYLSIKRNKAGGLLSELERKNESKSYGIITYPIAMLLLVIISFTLLRTPYIGGIGLMALSYGDGFAALVGKKFDYIKFTTWGNKKTISGCVGMFIATFISITIFISIASIYHSISVIIILSLILALVATFFEAFTPVGFDNITVPLSVVGAYYFILNICLSSYIIIK